MHEKSPHRGLFCQCNGLVKSCSHSDVKIELFFELSLNALSDCVLFVLQRIFTHVEDFESGHMRFRLHNLFIDGRNRCSQCQFLDSSRRVFQLPRLLGFHSSM